MELTAHTSSDVLSTFGLHVTRVKEIGIHKYVTRDFKFTAHFGSPVSSNKTENKVPYDVVQSSNFPLS
jgi:hypothetical protein